MKLRDFPFSRMTHKSGANENSSANKNDITAFQSSDACGFQNVAETRRQLQVLEELDQNKNALCAGKESNSGRAAAIL